MKVMVLQNLLIIILLLSYSQDSWTRLASHSQFEMFVPWIFNQSKIERCPSVYISQAQETGAVCRQVVGAYMLPQLEPSSITCISPGNCMLMNKHCYNVCSAYLTACFSLNLSRYSQEILSCLPQAQATAPIVQKKWAQFVSVVQKFRARYVHNPIY